jgi:hypothetical protein
METSTGGTKQTSSKSDWFARGTALLAIALTVIGLYFTRLTYEWQTKESLEERILARLGYQRNVDKSDGEVGVEIVNIGTRPIYVRYVEIGFPDSCVLMNVKRDESTPSDACGIDIYRRDPANANESMKALEPGEAKNYMSNWDFAEFPIDKWLQQSEQSEPLWVYVETTRKGFRQRPVVSWVEIRETVPPRRQSQKR